jgi:hypothetical protein
LPKILPMSTGAVANRQVLPAGSGHDRDMAEMDPITWNAFVDGMRLAGLDDATVGAVCERAARIVASTEEGRQQWPRGPAVTLDQGTEPVS